MNEMNKFSDDEFLLQLIEDGKFPMGKVTASMVVKPFNAYMDRLGLPERKVTSMSLSWTMKRCPKLESLKRGTFMRVFWLPNSNRHGWI